ncbi:MAG: HAD family hydrolase [Mycetocola sp.]
MPTNHDGQARRPLSEPCTCSRPPRELIIFDCDGVLVDSEVIAVEIDRVILSEHGWELSTHDIINRFLGRSFSHVQTALEDYLGHALPADWEERHAHRYRDAFDHGLTPVAGVEDALDRITLPTCIASSGTHDKLAQTLSLTGLAARFAGRVYSATEVAAGKPAPDLFLYAAEQMGVPADRCLVIEDSMYGVEAALAAGMDVLGYAGGLTPPQWLRDAGAPVFDDMRDLPDLINRVNASTGKQR